MHVVLRKSQQISTLLVFILTLFVSLGCARLSKKGALNSEDYGQGQAEQRETFPWQGERLDYDVNIANVKAMSMTVEASHLGIAEDGSPFIALYGEGRTFGLFALGYPLEDWAKTFINPITWLPYYAAKGINERGKNRTYRVHYWHDEHRADIEKWTPKKTTHRTIAIPGTTFDVISFVYLVRTISSEVGHQETWIVYDGWKLNYIYLVVQEKEQIVTPAGVFNATRLDIYRELLASHEAQGALAGVFVDPEITVRKKRTFSGNLWIADDEHRTPVQLSLETRLGSINVKLNKQRPPSK